MAVDPRSGALYVVYVGFNFGDLDVILQRSTDKGVTWSQPMRVNDDPKGNGVRQVTPQVFVAPNGRVDVIWVDFRASYPSPIVPKPAGNADVYYASSSDGGVTFTSGRRITDDSMNLDDGLNGRIGTYTWWGPAEAPLGNDAVLFAWGDPRFGNVDSDTNDMMFATLQLGDAGPPAISRLPKTSAANLSVVASQTAYPGGSERIGANFTSKLVVVNKNDVTGAWAGAVLARANSSPLLVVSGNSLTKEQKDEVKRLRPTGMFVIGDTSMISDKLVNDLKAAGVNTNVQPVATTAPTTVVPTTSSASSIPQTTAAPATTTTTLATSTANRSAVQRVSGKTAAEEARAIAGALDVRNDEEKSRSVPAFNGAVVVNPNSPESATALAFAASQRYPVLYVDKDAIPPATADAFNALSIKNTWVVGGPTSVSDSIMGKLPNPKRLGGDSIEATAQAVTNEIKARGLPVNIVYVADSARSADAGIAAAAVARVGGVLVLTPGASGSAAEAMTNRLGIGDAVDRIVVAKSTTPSNIPWVLFVVIGLFALAGLILLGWARQKSLAAGGTAPARAPTTTPAAPASPEQHV
jgi:putative cell wall-binding protein